MNITTIKIAGASGSGIVSIGDICMRACVQQGLYVYADREYPSLIQGGQSCYHISISDQPISSLSQKVDILVAVDRVGSQAYLDGLLDGGILIFGDERYEQIVGFTKTIASRNIHTIHLPERSLPASLGGNHLMSNMLVLGALWKVLGGDMDILEGGTKKRFSHKPELLKIALACLHFGYKQTETSGDILTHNAPKTKHHTQLLHGNELIALSAIHHGVKNYFAYPMSPSSTILSTLQKRDEDIDMHVQQVADEISAVQMCIGSMYAGSRALCATSGGGFDLMVESISLAAMTETPLVVIDAQRPGPATGLPTWTAQADLNMAIHSGHGECARIVVALSDHTTIFTRIGEALNLAERYQIPVIVLTEKSIADASMLVGADDMIGVDTGRHLVTEKKALQKLASTDRYACTDTGISQRWLPGSDALHFYANGDEHGPDGSVTEQAEMVKKMQEKRRAKMDTIQKNIPKPRLFGSAKNADISFIGWGSSLALMQDMIDLCESEKGVRVNYLHFDFVWPLETSVLESFFVHNSNVHLIEGNLTGQLGTIIEDKTKHTFSGKLLKYDGRRFFREDILQYIEQHTPSNRDDV